MLHLGACFAKRCYIDAMSFRAAALVVATLVLCLVGAVTAYGVTAASNRHDGAYVSATMSVNGVRAKVGVHQKFPPKLRLFILSAVKAKSVKVRLAGGAVFASGASSITIKKGKSVTLKNTVTRCRYKIKLIATSTKDVAPPATTGTTTTETTTTETTTTETTTTGTTTTGTTITSPTGTSVGD